MKVGIGRIVTAIHAGSQYAISRGNAGWRSQYDDINTKTRVLPTFHWDLRSPWEALGQMLAKPAPPAWASLYLSWRNWKGLRALSNPSFLKKKHRFPENSLVAFYDSHAKSEGGVSLSQICLKNKNNFWHNLQIMPNSKRLNKYQHV